MPLLLPKELVYLIREKIPFSENADLATFVEDAVENSNIALLQWILSKGLLVEHILDSALKLGNLCVLKWLHLQKPNLPPLLEGVYLSISSIQAIVKRGQLEILKFLHHSKMYTFSNKDILLIILADEYDYFDIVLWLHEEINIPLPFEDFYNFNFAITPLEI